MSTTVISVKIDSQTKLEAQILAKSVGIPLSTLINSYLKQIIATRRIELYAPETMTPKLTSLITQIESEIASGNISKPATSADDFLASLKS